MAVVTTLEEIYVQSAHDLNLKQQLLFSSFEMGHVMDSLRSDICQLQTLQTNAKPPHKT